MSESADAKADRNEESAAVGPSTDEAVLEKDLADSGPLGEQEQLRLPPQPPPRRRGRPPKYLSMGSGSVGTGATAGAGHLQATGAAGLRSPMVSSYSRSGETSPSSSSAENWMRPPPDDDQSERANFLRRLLVFMENRGQPILKIPYLGYQELDLYRLYQIVVERGGMDNVTRRQEWKAVYQELGIPTMSTSASYNTRTNYKKYLYLYELENFVAGDRNRPAGMEPRFSIGNYIRIISSNYEGKVFYAKISKIRYQDGQNWYYVHYNGWSTSHDEWMPESVLSPLTPEEAEGDTALLTNPHPNRSSKSNYLIGEQSSPRGTKTASFSSSQIASGDEAEAAGVATAGSSHWPDSEPAPPRHQQPQKPEKRDRTGDGGFSQSMGSSRRSGLRHRLRHQQQRGSGGEGSEFPAGGCGPTLATIQEEMARLSQEQYLESARKSGSIPLSRLTDTNIHRQAILDALGGGDEHRLKPWSLRKPASTADSDFLQVPKLDDYIAAGITAPSTEDDAARQSALPDDGQSSKGSFGPMEVLKKAEETIQSLRRELHQIRRSYRQRKQLLRLYYGPSSPSSSSSGASSSNVKGSPSDSPPQELPTVSIDLAGKTPRKSSSSSLSRRRQR